MAKLGLVILTEMTHFHLAVNMKKLIPFAIAYDFDGTLAPGNMQERDFIPAIGMNKKSFWRDVSKESEKHKADNILIYMGLMLMKAEAAEVPVRKKDFKDYGKKLTFFEGVLPYSENNQREKGWFDRVNEYGKQSGVDVQHYIVSSGIREMIEGTKIASKFKTIFASSFWYDINGVAKRPALALNYTTKTQYLFRINKGSLNVHDHKEINRFIPEAERSIPFHHMVYIGDGETDIPCFRVVKDRGGYSIAVYKPRTPGAKEKSKKLIIDGRANFVLPADYKNASILDRCVKTIIDKVAHDVELKSLSKF
jgi:hypothetical protein